eukprot:1963393-Prymnesium_polylepis.1
MPSGSRHAGGIPSKLRPRPVGRFVSIHERSDSLCVHLDACNACPPSTCYPAPFTWPMMRPGAVSGATRAL